MNNNQTDSNAQSCILETFGILYGVFFILVGLLALLPRFAPNQELFHLFRIDPLHSLVHIATGFIALWCVGAGPKASQLFFRWFGSIYAVLAVVGFWYGDAPLFGIVLHSIALAWLHLVAALPALILGFCTHLPAAQKPVPPSL